MNEIERKIIRELRDSENYELSGKQLRENINVSNRILFYWTMTNLQERGLVIGYTKPKTIDGVTITEYIYHLPRG